VNGANAVTPVRHLSAPAGAMGLADGKARRKDRLMILNAGSLFGSTLLTAGLGAAYWALAARLFTPQAVGVAAAAISAMALIGQLATFGLGTILMGELAKHRAQARSLIISALVLCGLAGAALGVAFSLVAGGLVPELRILGNPVVCALFAGGVAATAGGLVVDQAVLGLLRGDLQLVRNGIASGGKLAVLTVLGVGSGLVAAAGEVLFATWVAGVALSLAVVVFALRSARGHPWHPIWRAFRNLGRQAVRHHLLNLTILAPGLLLPLVVTALLSAEANAYFYISYLIAGFAFAIPAALAASVYAATSVDVERLAHRVRLTLAVSAAAGLVANVGVALGGEMILSIFGVQYATNSRMLLQIFCLGIFAVAINSLYAAIIRVERRFLHGAALMAFGLVVELVFVLVGATWGQLEGVGWGWLAGYGLGVVPFLPTLYRVAVRRVVIQQPEDLVGPQAPIVRSEADEVRPA